MDKDDDFLDAIEADNKAETQTDVTEATPEATPAPEGATAEPEGVLELTEVVEPPQIKNVPLSALLDERDRRKQNEDRAAMLEDQLRRVTQAQQAQQQQAQAPDPLEDPEGYAGFVTQQIQANSINTTLNMSEVNARQSYGDELVNAAQQWAKHKMSADPYYQQRMTMSPHPYAMVVADFQREAALQRLGNPAQVDEFLAWQTAQQQIAAPQQAAEAVTHQQAPPRSIASAPSAGGVSSAGAQTDGEMFDEVIKGL